MKKLLLFLLFVASVANAQIVDIPDPNLKAALLSADTENAIALNNLNFAFVIDANGNSEIEESEAAAVYSLRLINFNISDLTGIEAFTNLVGLDCSQNASINLDMSIIPNTLETFNCSYCGLSTLNVSLLANLKQLFCSFNLLTSLDVSSLSNLLLLDCSNNDISSLNIGSLENLDSLHCGHNSLTGLALEGLPNLRVLVCEVNQIATLDFDNSTLYEIINCGVNVLTSLDTSGLPNLIDLNCNNNAITSLLTPPLPNVLTKLSYSNNQLPNLDFTNLVNLTHLGCHQNGITSLDVSVFPDLERLFCGNNLFTALDLSTATNLITLDCQGSLMTSLDLSNLPEMTALFCPYALISSIDVSHQTALIDLVCGGEDLLTIYMKNGTEENLQLFESENLQFVCTDEGQVAEIAQNVAEFGAPTTLVSSYCSFVPGGNYNVVTGTVIYDENNNGCNALDTSVPNNVKLGLTDGTVSSATFLSSDGNYTLYGDIGEYILTSGLENPSYFNITPETTEINFPALDGTTVTQDFCLTANGVHPDLEVVLAPLRTARPGFDAYYQLIYKNKGTQTLSGTVALEFEDGVTDFVSSTPDIDLQISNVLTWSYSNLLPFESRVIEFVLNLNTPLETPPVNDGDILHFTASISPITTDEQPVDNTFDMQQLVVNSLDPNAKTCLEGDIVSPTEIGNFLHYNIEFENLGTAEAINVVVKDVIDASMFDVNSLQVIYASHPMHSQIRGNTAEFVFEGINLAAAEGDPPVGGHGNVLFKIKTLPTLAIGTEVRNEANIFFDYNAAIDTNLARTIFQSLAIPESSMDQSIVLYPNPTAGQFHIKCDSNIKTVALYDMQGRLLQTVIEDKSTSVLNISSKANGVYFVKVTTEKGTSVQKLLKD